MGKEEIKNEILELGFNVDSIGTIYWIEAIRYIKKHPLWWDIYDIYEYIADKYEITVSQAERNFRTAIAPAKKNIQKKYNYSKPIRNSTFLHLIRFKFI